MLKARALYYLVVAAIAIVISSPALNAQELSGRDIMDEVSKRHDRPYETENQAMTLIDKSGNTEERTLRRYAREVDGGLYRYLVVFDEPAGVRGVALLTWQNRGASDDQWIHLPAYGRQMKRSAEGGKRNYFMGTDFAFEDMTSEDRSKFHYERQPDETVEIKDQTGAVVETVDAYVVDAYPKDEALAAETRLQVSPPLHQQGPVLHPPHRLLRPARTVPEIPAFVEHGQHRGGHMARQHQPDGQREATAHDADPGPEPRHVRKLGSGAHV